MDGYCIRVRGERLAMDDVHRQATPGSGLPQFYLSMKASFQLVSLAATVRDPRQWGVLLHQGTGHAAIMILGTGTEKSPQAVCVHVCMCGLLQLALEDQLRTTIDRLTIRTN